MCNCVIRLLVVNEEHVFLFFFLQPGNPKLYFKLILIKTLIASHKPFIPLEGVI